MQIRNAVRQHLTPLERLLLAHAQAHAHINQKIASVNKDVKNLESLYVSGRECKMGQELQKTVWQFL